MTSKPDDILEGKSLGQLLAEGFEELAVEFKSDKKKAAEKFTCHKLSLELNPGTYSPALVKKTRKILNASQVVFAHFLGVSPQTVRAWEQGINPPLRPACRLIDEIRHNPDYWRTRLTELLVVKKNDGNKKRRGPKAHA